LNDRLNHAVTIAAESKGFRGAVSTVFGERMLNDRIQDRGMRQILAFMLLMAVGAIGAARYLEYVANPTGNAMAVTARPAPVPPVSSGIRTVTLNNDGRGHFQVEARVEGRSIDFLVDTGASTIALRESAAAKIGIHPSPGDYSVRMQTANGVGKAARVRLDRVEVADILVRDVDALVVPDEALSTNLLGMSFLSRVKWAHDRGRLVLEQ
jgi:aspartyl protease family protein